jgi:hypothetical protein
VSVPENFQQFFQIREVKIPLVCFGGSRDEVLVRSQANPRVQDSEAVAGYRGKVEVQIGDLVLQIEL